MTYYDNNSDNNKLLYFIPFLHQIQHSVSLKEIRREIRVEKQKFEPFECKWKSVSPDLCHLQQHVNNALTLPSCVHSAGEGEPKSKSIHSPKRLFVSRPKKKENLYYANFMNFNEFSIRRINIKPGGQIYIFFCG